MQPFLPKPIMLDPALMVQVATWAVLHWQWVLVGLVAVGAAATMLVRHLRRELGQQ